MELSGFQSFAGHSLQLLGERSGDIMSPWRGHVTRRVKLNIGLFEVFPDVEQATYLGNLIGEAVILIIVGPLQLRLTA